MVKTMTADFHHPQPPGFGAWVYDTWCRQFFDLTIMEEVKSWPEAVLENGGTVPVSPVHLSPGSLPEPVFDTHADPPSRYFTHISGAGGWRKSPTGNVRRGLKNIIRIKTLTSGRSNKVPTLPLVCCY